jgi:SpoVK/Ycf46/Vps4 family AAA+-type ATPase
MSTFTRLPSLLERSWDGLLVFIGGSLFADPHRALTESRSDAITQYRKSDNNRNNSNGNTKSSADVDWTELAIEVAFRISIAVVLTGAARWIVSKYLDPMLDADKQDRQPSDMIYKRLKRILEKRGGDSTVPVLNSYERQMAEDLLDPDDIDNCFSDIGGLDATKREIYELAIIPLLQPDLFSGKLVQPCKGILLYGKPGTGKTMLAKALAKESQAVFLPLQLSKILNKWVGESNKLVAATFSLATKLQPSIIFIDELDTFLKANNQETQYLESIKAEFLTLWDGVSTSGSAKVLVLGATNKPHTIDPAILRRMPRSFAVPLPNEQGRLSILALLLKDEHVEDEARTMLPELARHTVGYSGSDLKELCKAGAMVRIQERTAEFAHQRVMGLTVDEVATISNDKLRPIAKFDLINALKKVKRTGADAKAFGREEAMEQQREDESIVGIDANSLRNLNAMIRALSSSTGVPADISNRTDPDDIPVL